MTEAISAFKEFVLLFLVIIYVKTLEDAGVVFQDAMPLANLALNIYGGCLHRVRLETVSQDSCKIGD